MSVTCQPKCQIAVCGDVGGGVATRVNSTRTLFGAASAGSPPQLVFDGGRELPDVEIDRRVGIDRVQVQMMEARRREHAAYYLPASGAVPAFRTSASSAS